MAILGYNATLSINNKKDLSWTGKMKYTKRINRNHLLQELNLKNKIDPDVEKVYRHVICFNDSSKRNVSVLDGTIKIHKSTRRNESTQVPRYKKRRFLHRINIVCENCKQEVPVGRYDQHYLSGICKQNTTKTLGEELFNDFLKAMCLTRIGTTSYKFFPSLLERHPYLDYLLGENNEQYIDQDQYDCLQWIIRTEQWPYILEGYSVSFNWNNLEEGSLKWNLPITHSDVLKDMIQSFVQAYRIINNKDRIPILNEYYATKRS